MVKLARRPDRPRARFYIDNVFANFFELHGDRVYTDDTSVIIGLARLGGQSVMIIAQEKPSTPDTSETNGDTIHRPGEITPGGGEVFEFRCAAFCKCFFGLAGFATPIMMRNTGMQDIANRQIHVIVIKTHAGH